MHQAMILVRPRTAAMTSPVARNRSEHPVKERVMAKLTKGARITGAERKKLATDLAKAYKKGASIRELAETHGRSYGFIHRVLAESDVPLRGRGGATRGRAKGK
jgi:hypothetical protein